MGRAAVIIVPVLAVVCLLAVGFGFAAIGKWIDKKPQEPKKVRQNAALTDEAYELIIGMLLPRDLDNITILTDRDKTNIKAWAEKYRKVNS